MPTLDRSSSGAGRVDTLVLRGSFGRPEAEKLSAHDDDGGGAAPSCLVLDVSAVTRCDLAGLECWQALLREPAGPTVVLRGVRWSQFLDLLRGTPVEDLPRLCHEIRALVSTTRSVPDHRARPRERHHRRDERSPRA